MERIQQHQKSNEGHIGHSIEEEVRAIVTREKRQGNSSRGMHRQLAKSDEIASSLSRLFSQYGVEAERNAEDAIENQGKSMVP